MLTERGPLAAITAGTLVILGRRRWGANDLALALFDPEWLLGERAGCDLAVGSVSVVVPVVEAPLLSPIVACVCGLGCGITCGVPCIEWHYWERCGDGALSATSGLEVAEVRVYKQAVTG